MSEGDGYCEGNGFDLIPVGDMQCRLLSRDSPLGNDCGHDLLPTGTRFMVCILNYAEDGSSVESANTEINCVLDDRKMTTTREGMISMVRVLTLAPW